jgi:hypothetical protein
VSPKAKPGSKITKRSKERRFEHLVTTTPEIMECGRCKAMTLGATLGGLPYACDPTPLTAEGEMLSLLVGRRTYAWRPGHYLVHRGVVHITAGYPDEVDVLAEHYCGQAIPESMTDRARLRRRYKPRTVEREFGDTDLPIPF